jgi:prepilin-type N-terminal cleavage/methylation domain-containing protein
MARLSLSGFSLVEVMMALVVLAISLLALTSASVHITRLHARAGAMSSAAGLAASRQSALVATVCASGGESGAQQHGPVRLSWSGSRIGDGGAAVVAVEIDPAVGGRLDSFLTRFGCPQ